MLVDFFLKLRAYGLPVTLRELLDLLSALEARVIQGSIEDFYALARLCLVKDETHYDRFDLAFRDFFEGVQSLAEILGEIPYEWLRKEAERLLSEEEKARIESLGGFEELMRTLAQRLAEQEQRHQGGSRMIGTAGTSPFGAYGYNPEGVRIGQDRSRHRRAVKVWDERQFRNLADDVEVGTRNLKVALRKLRRFARTGAPEELDLEGTVAGTARNAGLLDLHLRPERRNAIKVLMFFDVGGSMDDHVRIVEELFSAARSEFKHLEYFYFHNCLYEWVWRDNRRRFDQRIPTVELLRTFGADYKVVFVGDATMSPYEITYAGGANEHWNEEPGAKWLTRVRETWRKCVWLNPQPEDWWEAHESIRIIRHLLEGRMYPLTLNGLDAAIRELR
ncbi:vWA domain-containing protein [Benzoatithermus flavus]|uniref:VWA domain-containing protein n=1 Tax=Benzoatithermus flavus TaxID=3108223 RepID=A0ABU8XL80_9PROT